LIGKREGQGRVLVWGEDIRVKAWGVRRFGWLAGGTQAVGPSRHSSSSKSCSNSIIKSFILVEKHTLRAL